MYLPTELTHRKYIYRIVHDNVFTNYQTTTKIFYFQINCCNELNITKQHNNTDYQKKLYKC